MHFHLRMNHFWGLFIMSPTSHALPDQQSQLHQPLAAYNLRNGMVFELEGPAVK